MIVKSLRYLVGIILLVLFQGCSVVTKNQLATQYDLKYHELNDEFNDIPDESRLRCYWWWLNSMATKESITRDLEQMRAKGYGGASIVDAGSSSYDVAHKTKPGPVFMSSEWMELFQHAVMEADRLDIELSVNVQSGWNPGAPSITPELAMKKLVYSTIEINGGVHVQTELPQPQSHLIYTDVVVQAFPSPSVNSPVKNDAITQWGKKSFNKSMGWSGIYPLHQLREGYENQVKVDVINKNDIVDITSNLDGNQLNWDAPEGNWTIVRYGWTCTGARTSTSSDGWGGLSLDHLSPQSFEVFRKTVIQPLIDSAKAAGNSLKYLQTDSWEMGTVNWTNHFPEEFERYRGYKIDRYLPVMAGYVVENQEVSNRFLHDIRQTVGDCVIENHYQLFADLAHQNGLGIHPESGGPHSAPVDALRTMAVSDFPQGEFWARSNTHRISDAQRLSVKQSACVAHTNGKRFVAAEGPTSIGPQWERSPKDLKGNIDRIFCAGVNRIVWHTFTSSPKEFGLPGNEYFAGTHLNPNVTWWNQAGDFTSYLNRCSYMLQQGLFVADVLKYYGDDVPNFVFLKDEFKSLHEGYDWDKCSKDILLNRASVENGKLVLSDGMSYRLLVLPDEKSINLEVLKKVEGFIKDGLTVLSPRPQRATGLSNYPESDQEVAEIAKRVWGDIDGKAVTEKRYGKGRVIWGKDINALLESINVIPDFEFESSYKNTALDYIHRTTKEQEIYFVVNRFARKEINDFEYRYLTDLPDRYEQVECKFRVSGMVPEIWDPMTGGVSEVVTYFEENGQTIIPLHLEPEGSAFVVFREKEQEKHIVEIKKDETKIFPENKTETNKLPAIEITKNDGKFSAAVCNPGNYLIKWSDNQISKIQSKGKEVLAISGMWQVQFDTTWGGPEKVVFDKLKSWTHFDEEGIKYYSGSAVYSNSFLLSDENIKNKKILLDLGNVQEMASVKINSQQMPVVWKSPFVFDITEYVQAGNNKLEVEVVNLWPNRLILDGQLPKKERLTRTNIVKFDTPEAEKQLRISGLLGPVKLDIIDKLVLKL